MVKKYGDDKLALRAAQGKGQMTSNKQQKRIHDSKNAILEQLSALRLPEIIKPKFSLHPSDIGGQAILSISDGVIGYHQPLLLNISLSIMTGENIAIMGDNGSGKTTLIRAILGDPYVVKSGVWYGPKFDDIGYLDQHYGTITSSKSVFETIQELVPHWSYAEIRRHLNDFLFRKNEEVNAMVSTLSGGEKVRLSLGQIAAKTPTLLILDEITNNIDLETRDHVIQVLVEYQGAIIAISHDEEFLRAIKVIRVYEIRQGGMMYTSSRF